MCDRRSPAASGIRGYGHGGGIERVIFDGVRPGDIDIGHPSAANFGRGGGCGRSHGNAINRNGWGCVVGSHAAYFGQLVGVARHVTGAILVKDAEVVVALFGLVNRVDGQDGGQAELICLGGAHRPALQAAVPIGVVADAGLKPDGVAAVVGVIKLAGHLVVAVEDAARALGLGGGRIGHHDVHHRPVGIPSALTCDVEAQN